MLQGEAELSKQPGRMLYQPQSLQWFSLQRKVPRTLRKLMETPFLVKLINTDTYCQFYSTWGHHTYTQQLMPEHKNTTIKLKLSNSCFVSSSFSAITLTIVSPIPRLKIPEKGARGRSLYPEDIQIGRAHPNKSEKWLNKAYNIKDKTCETFLHQIYEF